MADLLRYTNKSVSINNRLASLLANIQSDYQNGIIKTETEYYYRIKAMLKEFEESLTKPTFKFRPAISTPISDEYNAMITESYSDMDYIIKDCETLDNLVSQSFTDAELSRNMLTNELNKLSQQISAIGESIATNQCIGSVVFTEQFNNYNLVGNDRDTNCAYVDTKSGILTLQRHSGGNAYINKVEIDSEVSNGFPGNTHCIDTLNNELHFIGSDNLHNNLFAVMDGNIDTWYEFELFTITDDTRKECNSLGFDYDEGISWVNNEDKLRLKLNIYPATDRSVSWISLNPYLSDEKGVKGCIIESCDIITTSNNVYRVAENVPFEEIVTFPFPPYSVQKVEIVFYQPYAYNTKVGHFYYTSADTSSMSIFEETGISDSYARVPDVNPSVGLLGCKYNPQTRWIQYPDTLATLPDPYYAQSKLFTMPPSTLDKKAGQEIVDAYRYLIGIREIRMSNAIFAYHSQYVSKVFHTDEPITSIALEAEEYIPGNNTDLLKYFISLNGGTTWYPISPMHRGYEGICKYYVNNNSIENLLSNKNKHRRSKNLSFLGDPTKIQIKIELTRPDIIQDKATGKWIENKKYFDPDGVSMYSTPIVYGYKLKVTTGGDTIEY